MRQDRLDGYGGSCILLRREIHYQKINFFQTLSNNKIQVCAIEIQHENKTINIASAYAAPAHR